MGKVGKSLTRTSTGATVSLQSKKNNLIQSLKKYRYIKRFEHKIVGFLFYLTIKVL